jgi:tRNASer (uridine44-2'-O)-methyltransferase
MLNVIRNPNINSNHLFRADISLECRYAEPFPNNFEILPRIIQFRNYELKSLMVRTLIPRNMVVDKALDQTCLFYEQTLDSGEIRSLIVYLSHVTAATESPFYHPAVRGIAFLHTFHPESKEGVVSIHFSFFDSEPRSEKLERTAQHLLAVLHKHGQGSAAGYVKRVKHDTILPQATVQNTYARLKAKYAKAIINGWVEDTDPGKHVFEDLGIAAFLIELWAEMYKDTQFPGFVDIGCGNGLLVHILIEEGYTGWGFDARRRKSWVTHSPKAQENLKELVLVPSILETSQTSRDLSVDKTIKDSTSPNAHNGIFPKGTFIISNHADELTPWTPILATISECSFMMIPCCSHALSGARYRAPAPKGAPGSTSTFASLVAWVSSIARDCGWDVEKEMLRIPSTRNTALIGRRREIPYEDIDINRLVEEYGGAVGWKENAMKLIKGATRGH